MSNAQFTALLSMVAGAILMLISSRKSEATVTA
jgi:hypothetical protein